MNQICKTIYKKDRACFLSNFPERVVKQQVVGGLRFVVWWINRMRPFGQLKEIGFSSVSIVSLHDIFVAIVSFDRVIMFIFEG